MKYYADINDGSYLGSWDDADPNRPTGHTELTTAPEHGDQTWDGTAWKCSKQTLKDYCAHYRWVKETSGIATTTTPLYLVDTSDRSKVLLNGAYNKVLAASNPNATMEFKTGTGWQSITYSNIEQIALDVADHTSKCFTAEENVGILIDNDTIADRAGVESQFDTEYAAL